MQYFIWANDIEVRNNSYDSNQIEFEKHKRWFETILKNKDFMLLIFEDSNGHKVGQVRFEKFDNYNSSIGISVDSKQRGKKYAQKMLILSLKHYGGKYSKHTVHAFIKEENKKSYNAFIKAGFEPEKKIFKNNFLSFHLIKEIKNENSRFSN